MKTLVSNQSNWPKSGWVSNQNYHFNCWRLETCTEKQWNLIIPSFLQNLQLVLSVIFLKIKCQEPLIWDPAYCPTTTKLVWLYIYIARFHTALFLWTTFIHPASQNHEVGKKALLLGIHSTFIHSPVFHCTWLEDTGINLDAPRCFLPSKLPFTTAWGWFWNS